jgi:hypothetical protein
MLLLLIIFLHISTMFAAVTVSYGPTALLFLALRSGRTEAIRAVTVAAIPVKRVIPPLYGLGALFGFVAAIVSGVNLLAPWLLIAYVLFILLTAIGAGIVGPHLERLGKLTATMADGPISPELGAAVRARGFIWIEVVDYVGLFVIIFDMVVKPFS